MYVGQKAFINKEGKVLVLRDPNFVTEGQTGLDIPGGKYRWAEDLTEELKREVMEETSLEITVGRPFVTWTNYQLKTKELHANVFCVGYLCEYESGELKLSDEHDDYEWVDQSDYKKWEEDSGYFSALETYFKLKRGA